MELNSRSKFFKVENNLLFESLRNPDSIRFENPLTGSLATFDAKRRGLVFSTDCDLSFAERVLSSIQAMADVRTVEGPVPLLGSLEFKLPLKLHSSKHFGILLIENLPEWQSLEDTFFREVKEEDWSNCSSLLKQFYKELFAREVSNEEVFSLLKSGTREFFVDPYEGCIRSLIAMTRSTDGFRCLSYMITDVSSRGQGLGKRILLNLLHSKLPRYRGLYLHVDFENRTAFDLYIKCGFKEITRFRRIDMSRS